MKHEKVILIRNLESGESDRLGNIIYDQIEIPIFARLTEWTAKDIEVYGRAITSSSRKMLIKPFYGVITMQDKIRMRDTDYSIEEATDLGRWIMLIVKGYRA